MRLKLILVAAINFLTILLLSTLWEFGAEEYVSSLFGLSYDDNFEVSERLRFIVTSTLFSLPAMIIPGLIIANLVRKFALTEQKAIRMAHTDALTGAGNRRAFNSHIALCDSSTVPYAIIMIDVNDFKIINDLNGHHQGDATLVALAGVLDDFISANTLVFRIGGDEFALITDSCETDALMGLADNIRLRAAKITTGQSGYLSLSIGIARSDDCSSYNVVQAADLAMYQAKSGKMQRLSFFTPVMAQQFRQKEMLELSVADAVENNAIEPFLQPILSLNTGRLVGFEILSRWTLPSGEVVSPEVFIPVIEKLGLIDRLTEQLLQRVCHIAKDWPEEITLSLNIAPRQLIKSDLTNRLYDIMQSSGPFRLELEITENDVMSNSEEARHSIQHLKNRGFKVSLDDFGTGYSNLSILLGLGINKIKIDRSFISSGPANREQRRVVETLLALCRELKVEVTAEGIEDFPTLLWLKKQGCDYGQGYLFQKAMPLSKVNDILSSNFYMLMSQNNAMLPEAPGYMAVPQTFF